MLSFNQSPSGTSPFIYKKYANSLANTCTTVSKPVQTSYFVYFHHSLYVFVLLLKIITKRAMNCPFCVFKFFPFFSDIFILLKLESKPAFVTCPKGIDFNRRMFFNRIGKIFLDQTNKSELEKISTG